MRPDVIPQLADGAEVLAAIDVPDDVSVGVLIPNEKGLERALEQRDALPRGQRLPLGVRDAQPQERQPVDRGVAGRAGATFGAAREAGLRCEGVISVSFGCPYEGHVPPERVFGIARRLAEAGAEEVGFGDTTGMANPRQVQEFFARAREEVPASSSRRTSTTRAARGWPTCWRRSRRAWTRFESSFGELGGCPVPPGATGNIATEDLVSMLHEMGIETGYRWSGCSRRRARCARCSAARSGSHVLTAGPVEWND